MKLGISELFLLTGAQLKHDNLGRAAFVCWMSVPPYLLLATWALISQFELPIEHARGLIFITLFGLSAACLCSVIGLFSFHPLARSHKLLYTHTVLWVYGILALTACFLLGTLNLMTGLIMMAAPSIGLILFPPRLITAVFIFNLIGLLVLSLLSATGILPYAPGLGIDNPLAPDRNVYFTASMIIAASGYVAYQTIILMALINAWHSREKQVRDQSTTDALTNVANRRHVLQVLERWLHDPHARIERIALLLLDLDHFKTINDRHGHLVGDQALTTVARLLGECLREQDLVGRYGGEEFLLLLPGADQHAAGEVAERCRKAVANQVIATRGGDFRLTISLGVVSRIITDDVETDELIQAADTAMYEAKKAGRNCIKFG